MTPSRTRTVDVGRSRRRGRRRRAGPPPLKEPISLGFQFGATVAAAPHSRAGRTRGFVQILRRPARRPSPCLRTGGQARVQSAHPTGPTAAKLCKQPHTHKHTKGGARPSFSQTRLGAVKGTASQDPGHNFASLPGLQAVEFELATSSCQLMPDTVRHTSTRVRKHTVLVNI